MDIWSGNVVGEHYFLQRGSWQGCGAGGQAWGFGIVISSPCPKKIIDILYSMNILLHVLGLAVFRGELGLNDKF